MARARNIKPGFFRNADLAELVVEARLLFIGLWTLADRQGRLEDRPKQIKMDIFPADNLDCDALLASLHATGMLRRYMVHGKRYIQITNFSKHQNPHRDEKPSTIPEPLPEPQAATVPETVPAQACIAAKIEPLPPPVQQSTVQAQCLHGASMVAIGLNPESGFLNPETLTHTNSARKSEEPVDNFLESTNPQAKPNFDLDPAPNPHPNPKTVDQVVKALDAVGIGDVSAQHPELVGLVAKGVGVQAFAQAGATAVRRRKGFAYAVGILSNQLSGAAAIASDIAGRGSGHGVGQGAGALAWDSTRKTIEAQGVALGLGPWNEADVSAQREHFGEYTERVRKTLSRRDMTEGEGVGRVDSFEPA